MDDLLRRGLLQTTKTLYQSVRPLFFLQSADQAHENVMRMLGTLDDVEVAQKVLKTVHSVAFQSQQTTVGGVRLPHPFILAAGFVKGHGFETEQQALAATHHNTHNIMPGWRTMPSLVGPVEFGSFTRRPRVGNPPPVMWRDVLTRSTQNRVGLKNPGAVAAAAFLYNHYNKLPDIFGINIAPPPGISDPEAERDAVLETIGAFTARKIVPSWFTLNLSCPNTEDDPEGKQTGEGAAYLTGAVTRYLREETCGTVPLWVKVSPGLASEQYEALMHAFAASDVQAVVATNTISAPAPSNPILNAGIGGGKLHREALRAARLLAKAASEHNYDIDIVGSGGVQDPISYLAFLNAGAKAVQYWSALIYLGPLAAALIQDESE